MDSTIQKLIESGEGISVEFKRCGNKPGKDTFETICSFANRQGGHLLLGVLDDGTVEGLPSETALSVQRNIVNVINDPSLFNAAPLIEIETVEVSPDRSIIKIWVPMGPTVYSYKGIVYDRAADVDIQLKSDAQKASMAIRKQNYYTERTVYPWLTESDLDLRLLDDIRKRIRAADSDHPWLRLDDMAFLRDARLYARDPSTGERGFNLAAVMLLGKQDTILDIAPVYRTDVVVSRANTERYDDRLVCRDNLVRSYDEIVPFCEKWLPDAFALEGMQRIDVRGVIIRELVTNCLIHREFISPVIARITIDRESICTRNASRALFTGPVTLGNLEPTPKNPIIANFFKQMGLAEELGSGTRSLFKNSNIYTGMPPQLSDGDIFTACVPLPNMEMQAEESIVYEIVTVPKKLSTRSQVEAVVNRLLDEHGQLTAAEVSKNIDDVSERTVRRHLAAMVKEGKLDIVAKGRSTVYRRH